MRGFDIRAFTATHSLPNANATACNDELGDAGRCNDALQYDLHAVIVHKGQSLTEVNHIIYTYIL